MLGLVAIAAAVAAAGCTNVEQKYHLAPPNRHEAYPTLRPRAPTPPEPVLSPDEQKAEQARLEAAGKRVESIKPARLQGQ
ncbi:MAG TPA: hypothetical protein VHD15_11225 [Hyphomicrobiales bacterium]|nr:hypothetical protein [Hyphomicrobiales bacterium]